MKSFLTRRAVAEAYGIPISTLDRWRAEGRIPFTKIARKVLFDREDLKQFFAAHKVEAAK